METLEIEDLKILLALVDRELNKNWRHLLPPCGYSPYAQREAINVSRIKSISLKKSRAIIEQMIKDREFQNKIKPLPF